MKLFQAIFPALAIAVFGAAQESQPSSSLPQEAAAISGRVLKATDGSPLGNARLQLAGADDQSATFQAKSDGRGLYEFSGVPAGKYRLRVKRAGYSPATYANVLIVAAAQALRGIDFRLQPESVIVGRIVDGDGEPRPGVEVRAISKGDTTKPSRVAVSNDLGEYRLYGLAAGEYFVSAIDSGNPYLSDYDLRAGDPGTGADREYAPVFYPGTTLRNEAATIRIGPGQELRVDFKLQRAKLANLSGVVRQPNGRPIQSEVVLEPLANARGFSLAAIPARVDDSGRFSFRNVPPGDYALTATTFVGEQELSARHTLRVGEDDQQGLDLMIGPLRTITGRVGTANGEPLAEETSMMVWLRHRDGEDVAIGSGEVLSDGSFRILPPLPEGTYDVEVNGAPGMAYLRSARAGLQDALGEGFVISNRSSPGPLELTLDPRGAQIAGVLEKTDQPAAGNELVLTGEGKTARAITDDLGIFSFTGLRPGEYQLITGPASAEGESPILAKLSVSAGEQKVIRLAAEPGN